MRFLIDKSPNDVRRKQSLHADLVAGQLLTPLTRYSDWGGVYAIDNGAFSGFRRDEFASLIKRQEEHMNRCLFVTVPDVVGNGRRTLEIWLYRRQFLAGKWFNKAALVAQDGMDDLCIPWENVHCLFVGGGDPWKDSRAAADLVRTAKTLGKHVHAGRVNTLKRYKHFAELGVDTCDGSGVAMYDHMLDDIANGLKKPAAPTLWNAVETIV